MTIPRSADNAYTHTFPLESWRAGQKFVATMYDATGWGTGGVTGVMSESAGNGFG